MPRRRGNGRAACSGSQAIGIVPDERFTAEVEARRKACVARLLFATP